MAEEAETKPDSRFYMYGPNGEAEIFQHLSEVPDGWHDHPNKVPGGHPLGSETIARRQKASEKRVAARRRDAQSGSAALDHTGEGGEPNRGNPQGEPETGTTQGGEVGQTAQPIDSVPSIDDVTKPFIVEQLSVRKVPHNVQWSKEKLYQLLTDAVAPAQ